MKRWMGVCVVLAAAMALTGATAGPIAAQEKAYEFIPGTRYAAGVPTLKQVVGHEVGEQITSHAQAVQYLQALAVAAPQQTKLVKYAESYEGRPLFYFVISSAGNMAKLAEVQAGMKRLADPRGLGEGEAQRLIASLPAVTWLAYGVHGNEISSTDASLMTAYHLLAAQNDERVPQILEKTIVVLDPMQNPDGRDRFVNYFRETRGPKPDGDTQAAEHNERWPGGRSNHYLFDMNRDWFALTQPETRGRVAAYLEFFPVVYVDLHEMGSNATYYFAPPAEPLNPNFVKAQTEWHYVYGKNNAAWFDRFRIDYFTREQFDSFYPGYGEGWPLFHGSIGMTYEEASTRGLVVKRDDKTTMTYRDTVWHHFLTSMATAETTAKNKEGLLKYFYDYRRTGVQEGQAETVKEYILAPGRDPQRAAKFAALLVAQGIEVKRAEAGFTNAKVRDYYGGAVQSKQFPAGTFVISLAQPAKRLAKTLLDKQTAMNEEFLKEQIRLYERREPNEFYDVTGWSLPLLYDVEMYMAEAASQGQISVLKQAPTAQGAVHGGQAHLAYLVPWGMNASARALAELFAQGVRVFGSDKAFEIGGRKYPAGSLIVKVADNPADLHERLVKIAAATGAEIFATDNSWVESGVNFGSNNVGYLEPPRIALAWGDGVSSVSTGWTRYVLEQIYGLPVTIVNMPQIGGADLSRYNVLILPNGGGYAGRLGEGGAQRIRTWVQQGGTMITFGDATRWLTEERVGMLATTRELKSGKPEREERPQGAPGPGGGQPTGGPAAQPTQPQPQPAAGAAPASADASVEKMIQPERELPALTPGAILRVNVDGDHWLGFGYEGGANVMVEGRNMYTPLKLDKGKNIALYAAGDKAVLSGFTFESSRKQIGGKAYLMYQATGAGHVVAFAEDPNYRAFMDGLNLMFLNGVMFGPGH